MTTVKVKGMSCQHCVAAVTKALDEIEGTKNVKVDLSSGEASFDEEKPVNMDTVKEKIRSAGYQIG
jgi:copper chaperone